MEPNLTHYERVHYGVVVAARHVEAKLMRYDCYLMR